MLQWLIGSPEVDSVRSPCISTLSTTPWYCVKRMVTIVSGRSDHLWAKPWHCCWWGNDSSFRVDHCWNSTCRADSTNGYFTKFKIYTGEDNTERGLRSTSWEDTYLRAESKVRRLFWHLFHQLSWKTLWISMPVAQQERTARVSLPSWRSLPLIGVCMCMHNSVCARGEYRVLLCKGGFFQYES